MAPKSGKGGSSFVEMTRSAAAASRLRAAPMQMQMTPASPVFSATKSKGRRLPALPPHASCCVACCLASSVLVTTDAEDLTRFAPASRRARDAIHPGIHHLETDPVTGELHVYLREPMPQKMTAPTPRRPRPQRATPTTTSVIPSEQNRQQGSNAADAIDFKLHRRRNITSSRTSSETRVTSLCPAERKAVLADLSADLARARARHEEQFPTKSASLLEQNSATDRSLVAYAAEVLERESCDITTVPSDKRECSIFRQRAHLKDAIGYDLRRHATDDSLAPPKVCKPKDGSGAKWEQCTMAVEGDCGTGSDAEACVEDHCRNDADCEWVDDDADSETQTTYPIQGTECFDYLKEQEHSERKGYINDKAWCATVQWNEMNADSEGQCKGNWCMDVFGDCAYRMIRDGKDGGPRHCVDTATCKTVCEAGNIPYEANTLAAAEGDDLAAPAEANNTFNVNEDGEVEDFDVQYWNPNCVWIDPNPIPPTTTTSTSTAESVEEAGVFGKVLIIAGAGVAVLVAAAGCYFFTQGRASQPVDAITQPTTEYPRSGDDESSEDDGTAQMFGVSTTFGSRLG